MTYYEIENQYPENGIEILSAYTLCQIRFSALLLLRRSKTEAAVSRRSVHAVFKIFQ